MNKPVKMLATLCLLSVSGASYACYDHMMFNPNNMGLVEGTIARMAGLVPPNSCAAITAKCSPQRSTQLLRSVQLAIAVPHLNHFLGHRQRMH